jgi:hypothetical protein
MNYTTQYYWQITAWDPHGASNTSLIWNFTTTNKTNQPPNAPEQPSGPTEGNVGEELEYTTKAIDPDGDQIFYWFDWGNGENSGWLGPYLSNESVSESYAWPESGEYEIRVKAKDIYDAESNWSELLIIYISEQQIPQLEILTIMGGLLRTTAFIQNVGNIEATNVNWNISLMSGTIYTGKRSRGTIDSIKPGEIVTIKSKMILGLGLTDIIVIAETPEGSLDIESADALLLLIFVWIL